MSGAFPDVAHVAPTKSEHADEHEHQRTEVFPDVVDADTNQARNLEKDGDVGVNTFLDAEDDNEHSVQRRMSYFTDAAKRTVQRLSTDNQREEDDRLRNDILTKIGAVKLALGLGLDAPATPKPNPSPTLAAEEGGAEAGREPRDSYPGFSFHELLAVDNDNIVEGTDKQSDRSADSGANAHALNDPSTNASTSTSTHTAGKSITITNADINASTKRSTYATSDGAVSPPGGCCTIS